MSILDGLKTCRNGLHQYPAGKRRCPECQKEAYRRWHKKNTRRVKEYQQCWYKENKEKSLENGRHWRKQNPDKQREYDHRWYKQNLERCRDKNRRWRKENPDKARAQVMRRTAKKRQATPSWADCNAINAIYAEAVRLERETGIKHEVDHIYPLQSKYMCGLHVETNLQILTRAENASKGNRTWPGQLDCQKD